jgi:hypothetical protein
VRLNQPLPRLARRLANGMPIKIVALGSMARKQYKPEEIVAELRQVDVLVSQGQAMADAIRQIGVSEVTYYRWRQEFGGLKTEQGNFLG